MKSFLSDDEHGISEYSNIDVIYNDQHNKVTFTVYMEGRGGQVIDTINLSNFRNEFEVHRILNDRGFPARRPPKINDDGSPIVLDAATQAEIDKMESVMMSVLRGDDEKKSKIEQEVDEMIMTINKSKKKKEDKTEKFDPSTLSLDSIMEDL